MQASDALGLAFTEASRLERVFSRHDGGTPVSELNRAGRLRAAPAELVRVVNRSLFYGALTGGSFDVTVQPVIDLFRAHRNPSGELTLDDSELRAARALVGRRGLQVSGADLSFARSGMGITLDGIAKGYIADRVSAVLTSAGVKNHLVNAAGTSWPRGISRRVCRGGLRCSHPRGQPMRASFRFPARLLRRPAVTKSIMMPRAGITI